MPRHEAAQAEIAVHYSTTAIAWALGRVPRLIGWASPARILEGHRPRDWAHD